MIKKIIELNREQCKYLRIVVDGKVQPIYKMLFEFKRKKIVITALPIVKIDEVISIKGIVK